MMRTRGCSAGEPSVAARASASASSAVRNVPATPRTPSVPNSLRANARRGLALGELRPLAGLLQAGLLALLGARVAGEEAAPLELAAQVGVGDDQGARDAVAQRAGLRGDAAAVHPGDDVHAVVVAHGLQRLADVALQRGAREEVVHRLAVDRVGAVARLEDHAGDRRLALAGGGVAGGCAEVDGGLGDRLVAGLLGALAGSAVFVLAPLGALATERVLALADDVDLEVGAGDLGAHARGGRLVLVLLDVGLGHGGGGFFSGGRLISLNGGRFRGLSLFSGRRLFGLLGGRRLL